MQFRPVAFFFSCVGLYYHIYRRYLHFLPKVPCQEKVSEKEHILGGNDTKTSIKNIIERASKILKPRRIKRMV